MRYSASTLNRLAEVGLLFSLGVSLCGTRATAQSAFQEFITYPLGDTLSSCNFEPTPNGGFGRFSSTYGDQYFFNTDNAGLPIWAGTVHFDTPLLPTFGTLCTAMPDGGAIVQSHEFDLPAQGGWVKPAICAARIDQDGQLTWSKRLVVGDSVQITSDVQFRFRSYPDGSALLFGLHETSFPSIMLVMKIDPQGTPLWSTTLDLYSIEASTPSLDVALMPDGGCAMLYGDLSFGSGYDVIRLDANGDVTWANSYEMTNASWDVLASGIANDAVGNLVIGSERHTGSLYYGDMLWLSSTGAPYRQRLDPGYSYSGSPLVWNGGAIWAGQRAMDSTGTSLIGGYTIVDPGTFSNATHVFTLRSQHLLNDDLWLNGYYRVVDNIFSYEVKRPFLMRTPAMNITGCRLEQLPPAPINYIDVPDSLLEVTALNLPWWHTTTDVADTAVVVQDRNPNSIYDLCAIVGVSEEVMPVVTANVWPDPLAQGATLNVDATQPTDLVIHDLSGRVALELMDLRSTRQLSTSAFEPGTYIATGRDRQGARLWSRPFVVL